MRSWALLGLFLWVFAASAACSQQESGRKETVQDKTIESVLKRHTDSLMSLPGVVGTAQSECAGKPCIKVLVAKKTPELLKRIPSSLEGYPLEIQETGEIKARDPG